MNKITNIPYVQIKVSSTYYNFCCPNLCKKALLVVKKELPMYGWCSSTCDCLSRAMLLTKWLIGKAIIGRSTSRPYVVWQQNQQCEAIKKIYMSCFFLNIYFLLVYTPFVGDQNV